MRHVLILVVASLLAGCKSGDVGRAETAKGDVESRIVANLKLQFPSLRDYDLRVDSLEASDIDGLMRGGLVLSANQRQEFLLDAETGTLYLLAAPPVDVSQDADEALASIDSEMIDRHARLMQEVSDFPSRGAADAPVTIVEFSDFQCPYCARAAGTVDRVLAEHSNEVRLVYAHYPLPNHPWARPAAVAAECAAQQSNDAFWVLHDRYFEEQRSLTPSNVVERSRGWLGETGVDLGVWNTCTTDTSSPSHAQAQEVVDRGMEIGQAVGVSGTPHFVINGRTLSGARPFEDFARAVEQSLRAAAGD